MQCPNCGNEALNVNGKFVCLDCGVEIGAVAEQAPTPSVVNHAIIPEPAEPVAQTPTDPTPSLTDAPAVDPVTADSSQTVPLKENTPVEPSPSELKIEQENVTPSEHPVEDIFVKSLEESKESTPGSYDFASAPSTNDQEKPMEPSTLADFPDLSAEAAPAPIPEPSVPAVNDTPTEPSLSSEIPNLGSNPETSVPVNSVSEDIPTDPIQNKEPGTYFQPSSFDLRQSSPQAAEPALPGEELSNLATENTNAGPTISPQLQASSPFEQNLGSADPNELHQEQGEASAAVTLDSVALPQESESPITPPEATEPVSDFDALSLPQGNFPGEPTLGEIEEKKENQVPENAPMNAPAASNLDDLLSQYSQTPENPIPTTNPSPVTAPMAGPVFDSVRSGSTTEVVKENPAEIPSVQSVFGTPENNQEQVDPNNFVGKKSKKKILILFGIVVIVLILISGIGFGVSQLTKSSQKESQNTEEMFLISDKVSKAMDSATNLEAKYSESIDFSKVSLVENLEQKNVAPLEKIVTSKIEKNGTWSIDQNENVLLEEEIQGKKIKKVFIDKENKTYNNISGAWEKKEGFLIESIPTFFSVQNRGTLFYLTKAANLEKAGEEEKDGLTYTKIKITPKADLLKEVFNNIPALKDNKYENIDSSGLSIFALVDSETKIAEVSIEGDVVVTSSYFNGPVHISALCEYLYGYKNIETPVVSLPEAAPVAEVQIEPKRIVVTENRG